MFARVHTLETTPEQHDRGVEIVRDQLLPWLRTDDGPGGADPSAGTGILGLRDRPEAAGGTLFVVSPPGKGTVVTATLPVVG